MTRIPDLPTYDPMTDPQWADDDLATWCRVLATGPACPVPCGGCRKRPVTFGALRRMLDVASPARGRDGES